MRHADPAPGYLLYIMSAALLAVAVLAACDTRSFKLDAYTFRCTSSVVG